MITEKDMENAIVQDPEKYLGEKGLVLVEQQHRIGSYRFDLLFEDRFGARLIVELQKGTLDREHTYKILDYYDEYKEHHPNEFIELMVIANRIPEERKRRLNSFGVSFREIPEDEFAPASSPDELISPPQPSSRGKTGSSSITLTPDKRVYESNQLFMDQKNRFVAELRRIDKGFKVTIDPSTVDIHTPGNWYMGFIPSKWGTFRGSMNGVHFEFAYYNEKKTGIEYVRFSVGVENPLMSGFRDQFKRDVLASMESRGIKLPETEFAMWPNAGVQHGAKLLEYRTVLDIHAWERVINKYKQLIDVGFFNAVADVMKEYNSRGCFNPPLQFPT
jgi:hypothetical protein